MIHFYDFSEGALLWLPFLFMNNGTLKGKVSSFPSYCIDNDLMIFLLIPHSIHYSFRYGIDEVLGI